MHVWTRLSPKWENKSGYGLYADGMMELDWVVGQLLKKLDDLGIAGSTIVVLTTDNGAEKFSWPDGGTEPFRGEKGTTWEGGFRVPCVVRWPGVVKPNTNISDIASHEDWTPTFLAAAGVPDVKEQLLKGYKSGDKTFKVHLDAYDMSDLLSGKGPGQRKEIFYFDDSGSLNAFRYGDWKVTFATKDSWWADVAKPRTVPLVVNLRQDPFEMTPDANYQSRRMHQSPCVRICSSTLSMLFRPADFCRCGNSLKVTRNRPTMACAGSMTQSLSAYRRSYSQSRGGSANQLAHRGCDAPATTCLERV